MKKTIKLILLAAVIFAAVSCNEHLPNATEGERLIQVSSFGTESTLDIVSWNVEFFPMHDSTISDVRELIKDLDADIYALQEIENPVAFETLLDQLNGGSERNIYAGKLHEISTFLRLGILYKADMVDLVGVEHLFVNDGNASYEFASRLPLECEIVVNKDGQVFDFHLIVVHLKAFDGDSDRQRRRDSIARLANYLNAKLDDPLNDHDYVVAGDWNDLLDDSDATNVFLPLLDHPDRYRFLTEPFAGSDTEYSYIGGSFESLIDHIMITSSIDTAYTGIETNILKIDQEFTAYQAEVSDHRPVGTRIPIF